MLPHLGWIPSDFQDVSHVVQKVNMKYFFSSFFVYKRHDFFLFKKYILQVLVISGTIHTIFSADILYSINCLHVYYRANVSKASEMI